MSEDSPEEEDLFKLQTRVVTTAFIGQALMLSVIIFNMLGEDLFSNLGLFAIHIAIIYLYALANLVGFLIISFSSFLLNPQFLSCGNYIVLIGFFAWIIMTIVGFCPVNDAFIYVCVDQRCPESHWFVNMRFRNYGIKCPWDYLEKPKPTEEPAKSYGVDLNNMNAYYFNCQSYSIPLMVVSGIMMFCYCIFMIYALFKSFSFRRKLIEELGALKGSTS